jgi:hypothetical protein
VHVEPYECWRRAAIVVLKLVKFCFYRSVPKEATGEKEEDERDHILESGLGNRLPTGYLYGVHKSLNKVDVLSFIMAHLSTQSQNPQASPASI